MSTGPKIAFLVPAVRLSGGINVVMEHAWNLQRTHGMHVTVVITHHEDDEVWPFPALAEVEVARLSQLDGREFDLAIATFWDTVPSLWRVPAKRHAYFVQSLEDRFYEPDAMEASLARLTYMLGLPVITEARWIYDTLAVLTPQSQRFYARNGVAKSIFGPIPETPPQHEGPLRILLEATDAWYKGLDDSLETLRRMECDKIVTAVTSTGLDAARLDGVVDVIHEPMPQAELREVYLEQDVLLKHSRVEGMYGPPIEAFHSGATVVTTPVTGHDEYVQHGWNGMIVDWDDHVGAARTLDLLATDRRRLDFLRRNALSTARLWPSWDQATEFFAAAVNVLLDAQPDPTFPAMRHLHDEARTQFEQYAFDRHQLKLKVQSDGDHIHKLDELVAATATELHQHKLHKAHLEAERAELDARLADVRTQLAALENSRWLKLLSLIERPARMSRPGLGSVRGRLVAASKAAGNQR
jgi:glycosyltransferase involved in cell wall biosynthesis